MNWNKVNELIDQEYIRKAKHPSLPIWIYNYTHKAQFDNKWTPETLVCRGLVADENGKILARPFPKFFNASELQYKVPNEPFIVQEKLDGSLGILFRYNQELIFASRGSFSSDQAIEFSKIWNENYSSHSKFVLSDSTYLFEIIYPQNRIVVDYGQKRDVVYLGCINNHTGSEHDGALGLTLGITKPKQYFFNDFKEVLNSNLENHEGYVVKFLPSNYRVKVKFAEYIRQHKIITECSSTSLWEALMKNDPVEDMLVNVPDEFYSWVKNKIAELKASFSEIENKAIPYFKKLKAFRYKTRRMEAEWVEREVPKLYRPIVFGLLNETSYSDYIWRRIKPPFERPFSGIEE